MIDANDEVRVKEYNEQLEKLTKEIVENGYTEDKLKIVATVNTFPEDGKILPASKEPYVFKNPNCSLGIVVRDRIKKVDGIDEYSKEQLDKLKLQTEKYMPYNTKYVTFVYAAINGLFPDYFATNYIIVDSFTNVVKNSDTFSIKPELCLFKDGLNISNDAVFLIDTKEVEDLKKKYPALSKYKIVEYTGNPEMALNMYLVENGIVPQKISRDYVCDSETTDLFLEFINKYSQENNISLKDYDSTEYYKIDQENTIKLQAIYDKTFYEFLLKSVGVPSENYDELYRRLCEGDSYDPDNLIILDNVIETIGATGLIDIVSKYNAKIDERIIEKRHPNNEQILKDEKVSID